MAFFIKNPLREEGIGFAILLGGLSHYRFEQLGVGRAQLRQYFAVKDDIAFFQGAHKLAVIRAVGAADAVDVDVPQGAVVAFFNFAVAIIIAQRFHHRLLGRGQLGFAAPFESFGVFNYIRPALVMQGSSFYSWHILYF